MSAPATQSQYVISADGRISKVMTVTEAVHTNLTELLAVKSRSGQRLDGILQYKDSVVNMVFRETTATVAVHRKTLPMRSHWTPSLAMGDRAAYDMGAVLVSGDKSAHPLSETTCVEIPLPHWIIFSLAKDGQGRWKATDTESRCFMIANKGKDMVAPAVPNIYNNGKMCTGSTYRETYSTLQGAIEGWLKEVDDSYYNRDLATTTGIQALGLDENFQPILASKPELLAYLLPNDRKTSVEGSELCVLPA